MRPEPIGNVLPHCKNRNSDTLITFSVSNKILQVASPVFRVMFGPEFKEGHQLLQCESTVVKPEGDNASLMGIVSNILHSCGGDRDDEIDAE